MRRHLPNRGWLTRCGLCVYGGEVDDPSRPLPDDASLIDPKSFRPGTFEVIGIYKTEKEAIDAWKAKAWQTVDNAHARYRIAEAFLEDLPPVHADHGFLPGTLTAKFLGVLRYREAKDA
ncbi:hypothetical protein HOU02_gp352 [Caulobacter phage CcrBL9]|uniref:Uncharacterized protein n=1 Tax=Caulobacter phage CcrBL9 TaxID=2283270 RepID=A0A385EC71_9CAUD|nr:hypothetical protein HOU02_gp352 [Caulobacter phage CcrBL9]AXQ69373.1 hypothetical protein CcrBL9_gp349 [Caulobacter phage CcrBL9]